MDGDELLPSAGEVIAVGFLGIYFARFFLTFPRSLDVPRLRACLPIPGLLSVALGLAALAQPTLRTADGLVDALTTLAYLLIGVALLVHGLVTAREPGARSGLAIIAAGSLASVLPLIALYFAPTLLGRPALLTAGQATLALALLPASFAYAILRYRALDVRLLQRWLVHGLLLATLLAPCAAALYARRLPPLRELPAPQFGVALALLFMLLGGLGFGPLHATLWRRLDRRVFKDAYDYRASLQGLSQELSAVRDLDILGMTLPETLRRMMNLDVAALLVRDPEGALRVRGAAGDYDPALLPTLAPAAEAVGDEPREVSLAYGYLTLLIVPLRTHDAAVGHRCLGPKASGEPFRAEDRALLATFSGHLAAIVRNAQLVDDLRAKVRALEAQQAVLNGLNERLQGGQEEEQARLAADIHDEPLQTALHVQRQLAVAGERDPALRPYVALNQKVVDQLRGVCTAMRPAVLDDLGLPAALDLLALEQGERGGVPIRLETDAELSDGLLTPVAEEVLYRAARRPSTTVCDTRGPAPST